MFRKIVKNKRNEIYPLGNSNLDEKAKEILIEERSEINKKINVFMKNSLEYQKENQENYIKIICKITKFIDNFRLLIEDIINLSEKITFGFNFFEDKLEKTEGKGEITETFELIKVPLTDINNLIIESNSKFKIIKEIVQTIKIFNLKEIKTKMDITSQNVQADIDKIIKLIDTTKEKMKVTYGINFPETNKNEKENKKMDEELDFKSKNRVYILFIMDITAEMENYLKEVNENLLKMVYSVQEKFATAEVYIGFIGYKDICDLEMGDDYINIDFSDNYWDIYEQLKNVNVDGGGDLAEDVKGAFKMATEINWGSNNTKIAIFITDSPCHGSKYHDLGPELDYFYNEGTEIEEYIKFFAKNEISLFCQEIDDLTQKMFGIFQDIYNKNKPNNSKSRFSLFRIDHSHYLNYNNFIREVI